MTPTQASEITTDTFTEHNHPAWRVTGPLGTVTYRTLGNHLYFEPAGAEGESATRINAEQVRILAVTGTDDQVYDALRAWYERLPELATDPFDGPPADLDPPAPAAEVPADVRAEIERLRALRREELVDALAAATWYVHPNDLIGGWCVMPVDAPPSSGCVEIADVIAERLARAIADEHNLRRRIEQEKAEGLRRYRESVATRPDVRVGDVVHVPAGADSTVTTSHRVAVEEVTEHFGPSGHRVKADGTPMVSRSVEGGTKDGYVWGGVRWETLLKSTIYRDGVAVYHPEEKP